MERDHGRCVLCGTPDDLTIGHLLSVADALRVGATTAELGDDANLAAMCQACNLGLGRRSVSLLTATILHHLLQAERLRSAKPATSYPRVAGFLGPAP
jgi:5-methylcytosine-specific restriction endonuclease McrA